MLDRVFHKNFLSWNTILGGNQGWSLRLFLKHGSIVLYFLLISISLCSVKHSYFIGISTRSLAAEIEKTLRRRCCWPLSGIHFASLNDHVIMDLVPLKISHLFFYYSPNFFYAVICIHGQYKHHPGYFSLP